MLEERSQSIPTAVIPKPNKTELAGGSFSYNEDTKIRYADNSSKPAAMYLKGLIYETYGVDSKVTRGCKDNSLNFKLDAAIGGIGEEGYRLEITPKRVTIEAKTQAGLVYAVQTLRQLSEPSLFPSKEAPSGLFSVPCAVIEDKPRFKWRGLHLDVGRHFMPVEFIEKFIDLLAVHKMNVLHLHLTEDQGWRIESKKYPKLNDIGSWRDGTLIGHKDDKPQQFDEKPYGGYYTQRQLRHIVDYAGKRAVTVVPEIEMPGHAMAALAAYPQFSCTGGPHQVQKGWGIFKDIYCAGNEKTFKFLQDILDEVLDIFPSKYIHIGGDEAPKKRWRNCRRCQDRMKQEGLEDENQLQSYFIRRIEKYLNSKGRSIIGWDEILEGGLAPNAVVMSWRGEQGGIEAANAGHNVIMTPTDYCYLDFYQSEDKADEPLAIGGLLTLEKTYSYEPIPPQISDDKRDLIMGIQGNIWTEYMKNARDIEYMTFPRACALAEVGWTQPCQKDEKDFLRRLKTHKLRLEALEVNYRDND